MVSKITMPIYILTIGMFILVSVFSYSVIASRETSSSLLADAGSIATKEVMAMTNDEMGQMMMVDGTYRSEIRYEVPYGYIEPMTLEVTLASGVITESKVDFEIVNPVSESYVRSFENYYRDKVIGKPIAEVSLARVGGATLTNVAFDAALKKIIVEAAGGMMVSDTEDEALPLTLPSMPTEDGIVLGSIPDTQTMGAVQVPAVPQATPENQGAELGRTQETEDSTVLSQESDFRLLSPVRGPEGGNSDNSSDSLYKDGTYVVELAYYAWPQLYEPMQTTITLKDGVIVDAIQKYATIDYSHSIQYQRHFDSIYKNVVIGMPIGDAPIARVGQATETTDGFNEALELIKREARQL